MRSKSPLALMEQLVMVLVFALAAALCVQAFVLADGRSQQTVDRDHALLEAQNVAETLKSCRDLLEGNDFLHHCVFQIGGAISNVVCSFQQIRYRVSGAFQPKRIAKIGKEVFFRVIVTYLPIIFWIVACGKIFCRDRVLHNCAKHATGEMKTAIFTQVRCFGQQAKRLGISFKGI